MKSWSEHTHFAGLDWAEDHHDLVVVDAKGEILLCATFPHTREGWKQLREALGAYPGIPLAIETNQGIVIDQLLEAADLAIYPVNPKAAKRYRERKAPSGVKDDQFDAWSMADALRVDGHGWRQLTQHDALTEELRLITRDEVVLIEQRTLLANQLRSALRDYYPAALEAFDDWTLESSWAFVATFSTPQALVAAGKHKWEKFLHTHKLWRPQTMERRLEIFAAADQMVARASVIPIVAPLGRGTYSRPFLYGIYTLSWLSSDAQYYLFEPQDVRAGHSLVHYLGLGVEWWFNSSYR